MSEARELAQFGLGSESGAEILEHARKVAQQVAPSLFEEGDKKGQP
jgi:hypothetical protein